MKRSEMLEIIWGAINELEDADFILTAIEKAGMKPPYHPTKVYYCEEVTPTGNIDHDYRQFQEWEEEDGNDR